MSEVIMTPCGPIRGAPSRVPGATAYKGIRYATAGRWEYPRLVRHWEGEYRADRYGPCAIQQRAYVSEANTRHAFYYREFREGASFEYSEDCLFLNVFAPDGARGAPVIVYIHGGAFLGGSGDEKCFREPVWPSLGAIAVTVNYRLGPFGFMCLPQLADEAGHTGNYSLYDQLAALRWVAENIESFGGDPHNVTVMGQSAGAVCVQNLVSSPETRGLIHRAAMSSGGGMGRMFGPQYKSEHFYPFWTDLMGRVGADSLADFRLTKAKDLMDAFFSLLSEDFLKNRAACGVVVDGAMIPRSIHDAASHNLQLQIPYLIGSNLDDMDPPSMHLDAVEWARSQALPSFAYFFGRRLPGDEAGAFHSADLWFWFGTLDQCWRPFIERDHELSGQMTRYLALFARTGDPNGPGLPAWDHASGEDKVMRFGDGSTRMESVVVPERADKAR